MVKPSQSMKKSASEFFQDDPDAYEISDINQKTHLTKNILIHGIVKTLADGANTPFHEMYNSVADNFTKADTTELIDFVKKKYDLKSICKKGSQQILIEAQKNWIENVKEPYDPMINSLVAENIEYTIKAKSIKLNIKDSEHAQDLFDCGNFASEGIQDLGDFVIDPKTINKDQIIHINEDYFSKKNKPVKKTSKKSSKKSIKSE